MVIKMKIADMHCDTISEIWESKKTDSPQQLSRNNLHMDIQKMRQAGDLIQNFAMYVDLKKGLDPFLYVQELMDVFYDEMEKNKNDIRVIKTYDEILENEKDGKMSALMTIEEGGCCKGQIAHLEKLYQLGARVMTLTWNYPNELASPNLFLEEAPEVLGAEAGTQKGFPMFDGSKGLTEKGFLFIERMQELGMIVDVSHLSDRGFWDIVRNTKKPFVASHSNARALCGHARNLTDDMIRAIADRGGVIGLNYYGCFLNETNDSHSTVSRMAAHARHMINVGGHECLGLGSDFDGIGGELDIQDCSQVHKLAEELERQHFSREVIDDILYRNVMRVYRELL